MAAMQAEQNAGLDRAEGDLAPTRPTSPQEEPRTASPLPEDGLVRSAAGNEMAGAIGAAQRLRSSASTVLKVRALVAGAPASEKAAPQADEPFETPSQRLRSSASKVLKVRAMAAGASESMESSTHSDEPPATPTQRLRSSASKVLKVRAIVAGASCSALQDTTDNDPSENPSDLVTEEQADQFDAPSVSHSRSSTPSSAVASHRSPPRSPFAAQVSALRSFFGMSPETPLQDALATMNGAMGIMGAGPLPGQVRRLVTATGLDVSPTFHLGPSSAPSDFSPSHERLLPSDLFEESSSRDAAVEELLRQSDLLVDADVMTAPSSGQTVEPPREAPVQARRKRRKSPKRPSTADASMPVRGRRKAPIKPPSAFAAWNLAPGSSSAAPIALEYQSRSQRQPPSYSMTLAARTAARREPPSLPRQAQSTEAQKQLRASSSTPTCTPLLASSSATAFQRREPPSVPCVITTASSEVWDLSTCSSSGAARGHPPATRAPQLRSSPSSTALFRSNLAQFNANTAQTARQGASGIGTASGGALSLQSSESMGVLRSAPIPMPSVQRREPGGSLNSHEAP